MTDVTFANPKAEWEMAVPRVCWMLLLEMLKFPCPTPLTSTTIPSDPVFALEPRPGALILFRVIQSTFVVPGVPHEQPGATELFALPHCTCKPTELGKLLMTLLSSIPRTMLAP